MKRIESACLLGLFVWSAFGAGVVPVSHEICVEVVDGIAWTYRTGYSYLETDYGAASSMYPETVSGLISGTGSSAGSGSGAIPALMGVYIGDGTNAAVTAAIAGHVSLPSQLGGCRVIGISANAFHCCTNITSVYVPKEVITIEEAAFSRCSGLSSLTIPFVGERRGTSINQRGADHVIGWLFGRTYSIFSSNTTFVEERWEERDFSETGGLTWSKYWSDHSVEGFCLPANLADITITDEPFLRESAFSGLFLTKIMLPTNLRAIYRGMFENMPIKEVAIPNGVSVIDNQTFQGCTRLTKVEIPQSVGKIGESAFRRCSGLTSVTIPGSVTSKL